MARIYRAWKLSIVISAALFSPLGAMVGGIDGSPAQARSVCIGDDVVCGSGEAQPRIEQMGDWTIEHTSPLAHNVTCRAYSAFGGGEVALRSYFNIKSKVRRPESAAAPANGDDEVSVEDIKRHFLRDFNEMEVGPVTLDIKLPAGSKRPSSYRIDDGPTHSLMIPKRDRSRDPGLIFIKAGQERDLFLAALKKGRRLFVLTRDDKVLAEVSLTGSAKAVAAWQDCHERVLRRIELAK